MTLIIIILLVLILATVLYVAYIATSKNNPNSDIDNSTMSVEPESKTTHCSEKKSTDSTKKTKSKRGQQMKSGKVFIITIIILSLLLVISMIGLGYSVYRYNALENHALEQAQKITNLESKVSDTEKINNEIARLQEELDLNEDKLAEKEKNASQWQTAAINSLGRNDYNVPSNNIISVIEESESVCLAPGCDNKPKYNSYYCSRHECLNPSCHNPKANDLCMYCVDHKCMQPDCNNQRAYGKYYCFSHSK